jgi:hypothetical protein
MYPDYSPYYYDPTQSLLGFLIVIFILVCIFARRKEPKPKQYHRYPPSPPSTRMVVNTSYTYYKITIRAPEQRQIRSFDRDVIETLLQNASNRQRDQLLAMLKQWEQREDDPPVRTQLPYREHDT